MALFEPPKAKPEWGITPYLRDDCMRAVWGARAIYKLERYETKFKRGGKFVQRSKLDASIDILWDRQGFAAFAEDGTPISTDARDKQDNPVTAPDVLKLQKWINKKGMAKLRAACVKQYLSGDSADVVTIEEGLFTLVASPRRSYGYLYIGAWLRRPTLVAAFEAEQAKS